MPNRLPFVLVATSVLAPTFAAQTPPCLDYAPTNSIEWPSPGYGDGSEFRRVVAGYFDGSGAIDGRDVVVRAGETAVYVTRPHNWTTSFALDLTPSGAERVVDIAVLPNGIASGKDGLLVTDPDGFKLTISNDKD